MPKSKWGGKRPGAGRPEGSGEYPEQVAIRLTEEQYRHIMAQDCSAAEYLRSLIDRDMSRPPKED